MCCETVVNEQRFNLLKALINMHFLDDLRLGMDHYYEPKTSALNNILWSVYQVFWSSQTNDPNSGSDHFRLQTLYCNDALDASQILKSQTKLQIFGIYGYPPSLLETLK